MNVSTAQLASARQAADELFEALSLRAYLFEVEPQNDHWLIQVECAVDEGWMTTDLHVEHDLLIQSRDNPAAREQLLQLWDSKLSSCHRNR